MAISQGYERAYWANRSIIEMNFTNISETGLLQTRCSS
jgi:hypothetical protein